MSWDTLYFCYFSEGDGGPNPCPPSGPAHEMYKICCTASNEHFKRTLYTVIYLGMYIMCRTQCMGGPRLGDPALENHKNIVFLAILVRISLKIKKLPSQQSIMASFYRYLYPLSSLLKKKKKKREKKVVRVGPFLAKLSGSAHAMHTLLYFCFCCHVVNNFLCLFLMAACGLLLWHFLVILVYVSIGHIYFLNDDVNFWTTRSTRWPVIERIKTILGMD